MVATRSDINRTKTSETLRTKGNLTGNFGRPKVKINPGNIDIPTTALKKDNLTIANPDEYLKRIVYAYKTTTDVRLKKTLAEIIKQKVAAKR